MKDHVAQGLEAPACASFLVDREPPRTDAPWYLIDLAKCPDALRRLFEAEPIPRYDLPYLHSGHREQAYHGPLLVEPSMDDGHRWLRRWLLEGKALALYGQACLMEEVRDHFASLNWIHTLDGEGFLRYADPVTFASFGDSLSRQQCQRLLGPLSAIHGFYAESHWALIKGYPEEGTSLPNELARAPFELTRENLAAITVFRQKLLAAALADSHGLHQEVVTGWFEQLAQLGAPSEQGLVEGAELLIQAPRTGLLSDDELASLRRQGGSWADTLEALVKLQSLQEGP